MGNCRKMNQSKSYVYALFAIVVVGTGLGGMTQTALNAMADVVLSDLGTEIGWGQWLATIYIFCMGAAVPLASYLQRKLSARSLILYSYGLYLIGSLCDCLAVNFPMLIIGRVLEALGTGVLMPLLQTIAMTRFPENRHGTAMGIAGIALGFAPNIGPVVGGALCTAFSWRAMFLILACASAVLIVCALAVVREREVKDAAAHLDVTSLVFSTFGFGGLLLGFTAAANMGLTEPLVWAPVLVGIACVALFVTRQHTISEPLLDLRIFTFREYLVSIVAQCLLYGCFMGMTLIIPLTVIEAGGHNAFEAGLVLFPGALAALVFEPGAGMATDRFGARKVAIFGGCFLVVGLGFFGEGGADDARLGGDDHVAPDRSVSRDGGHGLSHRVLPAIGRVYGLPCRTRVLGASCARVPSRRHREDSSQQQGCELVAHPPFSAGKGRPSRTRPARTPQSRTLPAQGRLPATSKPLRS